MQDTDYLLSCPARPGGLLDSLILEYTNSDSGYPAAQVPEEPETSK